MKTQKEERLKGNANIFDFEINDEEMKSFDSFNIGWRHFGVPWESHHPDYPFKDELPADFTKIKPPKR